MAGLHGNVYDLGNGFYQSYLYNVLAVDGLTLDGHYTVIFNKDVSKIYVYKHGDYRGFTSIQEVEFKGFISLNGIETSYFKEKILITMKYKLPYSDPKRKFVAEAIFDYSFDIFGIPVYWETLNNLK